MLQKQKKPLMNEQIGSDKILLIDNNGEKLGIKSLSESIYSASSNGFDVVQVGVSDFPVCKLINYNKFLMDQKKKKKENINKNKIKTKEVRFNLNTSDHDIKVKIDRIYDFFNKGDRVKICISKKGCRDKNINISQKFLSNILKMIELPYSEIGDPVNSDQYYYVNLAPNIS